MRTQLTSRWLAVPMVLALAILACGGGTPEPTATPFPKPTQRPATEAPTDAPRPTRTPQAEVTPEPDAITLSADPYTHPSGAFNIRLPEGWEISERDNSVFVDGPASVASIEVAFTNVGLTLDEEALTNFVDANEANWFGTFANYEETSRELQSDGSLGVLKTLELSDGTPQTVFSYYWQEGNVVYEQDFWVNSDAYDVYVDVLVEVANSMVTDPAAGEAVPLYAIRYTFTGPENLFEFLVPYGWTYATDSADNTIVDTFTAPDGQTFVESIAYDDGQAISKSAAGGFALELLKSYYNVNDIRITDDEVQADGSERLNWVSDSGGIEGTTFFETRGTTFLLLTWIVTTDYFEVYRPVWIDLLDSYAIPEQ